MLPLGIFSVTDIVGRLFKKVGEKQEHAETLVSVATCIRKHFQFLLWQPATTPRPTLIALQIRNNPHKRFSILPHKIAGYQNLAGHL